MTAPLLLALALAVQEPQGDPDEHLFVMKIMPLFKAKCLPCHGEDPKGKIKGKLDMRTREGLLKGGDSGLPALAPGDPDKSPLYVAATWKNPDLEMPPKENDRLKAPELALLRRWIRAGAPWPGEERRLEILKSSWSEEPTADGVMVRTSGGLAPEWTYRRYLEQDLWAFRPVRRPDVPGGAAHPVDAFIRAKLSAKGLAPAKPADRRTLLRRATFDLTGLPPTPEEIRAFLDDDAPNAWEKVLDRLLASPHYGERWGQHWLDVTRYADTSGFSNDWERSNAWRYRDYVVRSINADKPYDRFIREQIAGDEIDPENPEMIVAAGFLRMGPWEHTPMSPESVTRQLFLDDATNSIGQTFLSLPLRCARCHDHKFDPIPTRDYYRIYAALATTQPVERPAPFLDEENRNRFPEGKQRLRKLLEWAKADVAKIKAKEEAAARKWCAERGIPYVSRYQATHLPEGKKPPRHVGLDYYDQGFLKVRQQDVRIWTRRLERYEPMAQSVYSSGYLRQNSMRLRMAAKPNEKKWAKAMPKSQIYSGGDVYQPVALVKPGTLSAVPLRPPSGTNTDPWLLPEGMTGRRTALADWIADGSNPLTTRSIVNRVWQYHFGRAIAANPNNFGNTGAKPSHPELLDWLASEFVRGGWSLKKLHKRIMTSETYRQSGVAADPERRNRVDPDDVLLSRFPPRRLSAEELRDAMLAVSGELNREVGGLPVFPEMNLEVALAPRMLQFSLAPAYQPSRTPAERNRRSIYIYRGRGLADPDSEVFNKPRSDDSCERRDASTVTPQVFALLNGGSATDRSIAMALRLEKEKKTSDERIGRAFALAMGRPATDGERKRLAGFVSKMEAYHRDRKPEAEPPPREVTRSVVEEMSGLAFDYQERLDAYDDYVFHPRAWEVSPGTRALADLCLVLFNSNEFIYVY